LYLLNPSRHVAKWYSGIQHIVGTLCHSSGDIERDLLGRNPLQSHSDGHPIG
jgi:hypothetical protein